MKFLSLLMLLIIQFGSFVPCCGPEWGGDATATAITDECCSQEKGHDVPDRDEPESCSPFFTCGTCGGFVFEVADNKRVLYSGFPPYSVSAYCMNVSDGYRVSQWQPPRLRWS